MTPTITEAEFNKMLKNTSIELEGAEASFFVQYKSYELYAWVLDGVLRIESFFDADKNQEVALSDTQKQALTVLANTSIELSEEEEEEAIELERERYVNSGESYADYRAEQINNGRY